MTENKMRKETNEEWNSLYEATFDGIKAPYELYRKVAAISPYTQQPEPAGSDALWYPGPAKKRKWCSVKK